jgi:small subunit ribosomal protein S1
MDGLHEGETRHGKVTSITDFGAFVDLGGADGLIHVSELSWRRVEHPREVLKVGDEVDVYVLSVDRERRRIALSLKKLQPDPWTVVDDQYHVGQLVEGCVTRVVDFGAFVALDLGIEGLLHANEMIGTPELSPADIVRSGDKLPVKIIGIDSRRKRLDLSAKQVRQDEWERWMAEQQAAQEEEVAEDDVVAVEPVAEEAAAEADVEAAVTEAAVEPVVEEAAAEAEAAKEMVAVAEETAAKADAEADVEAVVAEVAVEPVVEETAAEADVETVVAEVAAIVSEMEEADESADESIAEEAPVLAVEESAQAEDVAVEQGEVIAEEAATEVAEGEI